MNSSWVFSTFEFSNSFFSLNLPSKCSQNTLIGYRASLRNHFKSRFLLKHSNVGNKELEFIFSCQSRTLCSVIWNHMLREQNKRFITRFFYSVRKNKNLYCFNKFKGTCCYLKLRLFLNQKPCMIKFLPNHKTNFRQLTSWCWNNSYKHIYKLEKLIFRPQPQFIQICFPISTFTNALQCGQFLEQIVIFSLVHLTFQFRKQLFLKCSTKRQQLGTLNLSQSFDIEKSADDIMLRKYRGRYFKFTYIVYYSRHT